MKLTYWVAPIIGDSPCYNIRARTKKAVVKILEERGDNQNFEPPIKVTIEYSDSFDLVQQVCSEEGISIWETNYES